MRAIFLHQRFNTMVRVVTVPCNNYWLTRFNRRFEIKKNWDGTFKSRLGWGYCMSGKWGKGMEYTFCEVNS